MTVDEIFRDLSAHMIKGMMTHEELANYYDFLNLKGYSKCHEYHFFSETCSYRKLCRYFINRYSKIVPYIKIDQPSVIPENWYTHVREDVDPGTKRNAVKSALTMWVNWEKETKALYQNMYIELFNIGEIAAANFMLELIKDVDIELKQAEKYMLNKMTTNFDIIEIVSEQEDKYEAYEKKLKECLEF